MQRYNFSLCLLLELYIFWLSFPDSAAAGAKKGPRNSTASPVPADVALWPFSIPIRIVDTGVGAGAGSRRRLGERCVRTGYFSVDTWPRMPWSPRRTGSSSKSRLRAALLLHSGVHGRPPRRGHQTLIHTDQIYEFLRIHLWSTQSVSKILCSWARFLVRAISVYISTGKIH